MLSSLKFKKILVLTQKVAIVKNPVAKKNTVNVIKVVFFVAKNVCVMVAKIVSLKEKRTKMRSQLIKQLKQMRY